MNLYLCICTGDDNNSVMCSEEITDRDAYEPEIIVLGLDEGYVVDGPVFSMFEKLKCEDVLEFFKLADTKDSRMCKFFSAAVRALLNPGKWTSTSNDGCIEAELMNKDQLREYLNFTSLHIDDLDLAECDVLKTCYDLYKHNMLPSEEFKGCL